MRVGRVHRLPLSAIKTGNFQMKKVILAATAMVIGATVAHAQAQPTQPDPATTLPAPDAAATPAPAPEATPTEEAAPPASTNDAVTTGSGDSSQDPHKKHKKDKPKA